MWRGSIHSPERKSDPFMHPFTVVYALVKAGAQNCVANILISR
jgi:hypothetical protein